MVEIVVLLLHKSTDLGLRLRYYQSGIDKDVLLKGDSYNKLPKSFIIFICTYDPLGRGKCRYTILPRCIEADVYPETRQEWILLNTEGTDRNVSKEVYDFLRYRNHRR